MATDVSGGESGGFGDAQGIDVADEQEGVQGSIAGVNMVDNGGQPAEVEPSARGRWGKGSVLSG